MRLAVFARNHGHYLAEALKVGSGEVTFRSVTRWAKAKSALEMHTTIPVYFAVIGEGPHVTYKADLVAVHLNPDIKDPITKDFLDLTLDSTAEEGLWESDGISVGTLYKIKRCRKLSPVWSHLWKTGRGFYTCPSFGASRRHQ